MPQSIYARAAARGFPVFDYAGQSGQGALPDSTAPAGAAAAAAGNPPSPGWTDPGNDPASVPAAVPPPEMYVLGGLLWGLPGAANPDNTPRTHAAPFADPTAPGYAEAASDNHGPLFTGVAERQHPGSLTRMRQGRIEGQGSTADTLQPLTGQIRAQAGYDAVQGYGGGGPGPGGVNDPQGPHTDDMTFGGYTYHNVFVSAAEVPLITPDADQFIAAAPELPPYAATFDAPTAAVLAQDPPPADVPAQGPQLQASLPAYATSFWG